METLSDSDRNKGQEITGSGQEETKVREFIMQKYNKLDTKLQMQVLKFMTREAHYQKMKDDYNKKAFLKLPSVKTLEKLLKDEIGENTDALRDWYSASVMTFISSDPLISANYVSKKKIVTRTPIHDRHYSYFQGEVNDNGMTDGV